MENNKNKKSVKFQGEMLNFCDFIQVFVFTRNHHLNVISIPVKWCGRNVEFDCTCSIFLIMDVVHYINVRTTRIVQLPMVRPICRGDYLQH